MRKLRHAFTFVAVLVGLLWAAPEARAQDGQVFLVISLVDEFSADFSGESFGSDTVIVNIGTLIGGAPDPRGTRFEPAGISTIPLPSGLTFADLADNSATIFGSFETEDLETTTPHMVTPTATDIDPAIQAGTFAASGALAAAVGEDPFMTTGDIASIVHEFVPQTTENSEDEAYITLEEVAEALFDTDVTLSVSASVAEAEGGLLPHEPGDAIFNFKFEFNSDGDFSSDVCLIVEATVQQQSINVKTSKSGSVAIAILGSDDFDVTEITGDIAVVGVVAGEDVAVGPAVKKNGTLQVSFDDVNEDGNLDLVAHFSVPELVEAGLLTSSTTELTIRADTDGGGCVEGTDESVTVK